MWEVDQGTISANRGSRTAVDFDEPPNAAPKVVNPPAKQTAEVGKPLELTLFVDDDGNPRPRVDRGASVAGLKGRPAERPHQRFAASQLDAVARAGHRDLRSESDSRRRRQGDHEDHLRQARLVRAARLRRGCEHPYPARRERHGHRIGDRSPAPVNGDALSITGALGVCASALWPQRLSAQNSKTRLILLGTGGGPRPRAATSASAQVIVANGAAVRRRLRRRRRAPAGDRGRAAADAAARLHHASAFGSQRGLRQPDAGCRGPPVCGRSVDTWGPPPLAEMTRLFFEMNAFDINTRIADEGRVSLGAAGARARAHRRRCRAAGRQRQGDRGGRRPSADPARIRVPLRCARSLDRDFR